MYERVWRLMLFNLYFLSRQYLYARLSRKVARDTYCPHWWTKVTCACDATTLKSVRFVSHTDNVERIRACYDVRITPQRIPRWMLHYNACVYLNLPFALSLRLPVCLSLTLSLLNDLLAMFWHLLLYSHSLTPVDTTIHTKTFVRVS